MEGHTMQLTHHMGPVQNMGWIDRVLRFALGFALIVLVLLDMDQSAPLGGYAYLPLLAIYPLITAILGWDPLYAMGHIRSCEKSGRNQCGTFPYEIETAMGKKLECGEGDDCSVSGSHPSKSKSKSTPSNPS